MTKEDDLQIEFLEWLKTYKNPQEKKITVNTQKRYANELQLTRGKELEFREMCRAIKADTMYSIQTYVEYKKLENKINDAIQKIKKRRVKEKRKSESILLQSAITVYVRFLQDKMNPLPDKIAEEISKEVATGLYEGAKKQITVNAYERNNQARQECIAHHGCRCSVCDFDFEKMYGNLGEGFIHVHHIKPLSKIGKSYKVDFKNDLVPVCPNCHSMIHRNKEALTVDELKQIIKEQQ